MTPGNISLVSGPDPSASVCLGEAIGTSSAGAAGSGPGAHPGAATSVVTSTCRDTLGSSGVA